MVRFALDRNMFRERARKAYALHQKLKENELSPRAPRSRNKFSPRMLSAPPVMDREAEAKVYAKANPNKTRVSSRGKFLNVNTRFGIIMCGKNVLTSIV